MNENSIFIISFISILAGIFSTFSFCICLSVAKNLGKRLKRESLLGEVIAAYCEIREFNTRCKLFLHKISSSVYYQILGSLPSDLERVFTDTNQVFLQAFKSADEIKLMETKAALSAISSRLHNIMNNIELRLKNANYY
ncbi:MAG TPA: hypothetical protein VHO70_23670 [Chitinispirillaceae bacterium]|nr:hypothetical protein [Chitinispirillaceae bacterium]